MHGEVGRRMRTHSLRFRMVIVLMVMILIMSVSGKIMYRSYERQYSEKLFQMNSDVTYQLVDNIATQYRLFEEAQEAFSVNTTVNRFLSTDSEYEKLTLMPLYESLQKDYKRICGGLHSIVLKKKDGSIFSDPIGISEINISHTAPAFRALEDGGKNVLIVSDGKAYIAMKRDVYQSGGIRKRTGSCMFVIAAEGFTGNLMKQDNASREIFVIDREKRIIAHNGGIAVASELPASYAAYLGDAAQQRDGDYIAVSESIPDVGWSVLCLTPKDTIFSELKGIQYTFHLQAGLMMVLVSAVYLWLELSISHAFGRMIAHINDIADGKQVEPLSLQYAAEFQQVAQAFNHMMRRLEELNRHNMEYHEKLLLQSIENKQSQLLALQSQINPHFLYNTLECINSAGAICGSREVEEMSTALAYIFRYACKGENITRIRDEVETLKYYLNIQQIRFPGRFRVEYAIAEGLMEKRVLKFLLQPIVENSILHGFQDCSAPCVIRVGVTDEAGKLVIAIEDNGTGIAQAELEALRGRLNNMERSTDSIGLINIQRRIRLYYGDEYGLVLQSEYGKGTKITVLLPDAGAEGERENV